jgi:hypothetical protein
MLSFWGIWGMGKGLNFVFDDAYYFARTTPGYALPDHENIWKPRCQLTHFILFEVVTFIQIAQRCRAVVTQDDQFFKLLEARSLTLHATGVQNS